ncbi:luciferin 4-monooxygenase-like [Sergentomyia squamirostris]
MENIFKATLYDQSKKQWRGASAQMIFRPQVSLGRAALFVMDKNPDFVAQISANSGVQKTNREITNATLKIAVNLQKMGCKKGDVIGFVLRNNENLAPAVLACLTILTLISAVDPTFTTAEMVHMFGITRPKIIFCESNKLQDVKDTFIELMYTPTTIVFGDKINDYMHINDMFEELEDIYDFTPPEVDDNTCAVILCSSGTTGLPKGVALNHAHLLCISSYGFMDKLEKPLSVFCFSSLYWYSGLMILLMGTLTNTTRIITSQAYSPEHYFEVVTKYKPNILFTVPIQLSELIENVNIEENTMDCVKRCLCVGSPLSMELWLNVKKFLRNGDIYNGYGMSEIGFISREPKNAKKLSAGVLLTDVEAKVIDEDGNRLEIDEQGELCFKWRHMFLGYYNSPKETAKVIDAEGFIHSGDIGYFDEDNLLHIIGRSKDIIKYRSYSISPGEIESVIMKIPGIRQAYAVGIYDTVDSELPAAVVIRKEDASVTEEEIIAVTNNSLIDPKHLRGGVFFVEHVPTTASGKVKKALVKEMAEKMYLSKNS